MAATLQNQISVVELQYADPNCICTTHSPIVRWSIEKDRPFKIKMPYTTLTPPIKGHGKTLQNVDNFHYLENYISVKAVNDDETHDNLLCAHAAFNHLSK